MRTGRYFLWGIVISTFAIRLISLGLYPLMDTTEARYGEMARIMVQTHNWLTPQFDYGVPFWGKPPLFAWMSAVGIKLIGLSEFSVRFPHWLAGVAVLGLMAFFSRRVGVDALRTAAILASCGIFVVSAGVVETDMALTLAMTMAMVGFYLCWSEGKKSWGYLGFVGLAIGLLAKGPLIIVLVGLSVMPWLMLEHGFIGSFKVLWRRFPVVGGSVLMLAIALPWYVMAERATPGFLDYFLLGEYVKRFLDSGWKGDLYGSAHQHLRGTIWLYWLYAALPWSIILPIVLWVKRRSVRAKQPEGSRLVSFLLCWMLSPLLLFTLAGNILPAYVLPGIPAVGMLMAALLSDSDLDKKWFKSAACLVPVLLIGALVYIHYDVGPVRSDKVIFEHANNNLPTYYVSHRTFSGQYYSDGKALQLTPKIDLAALNQFQLVGEGQKIERLIKRDKLTCEMKFSAPSHRSLYLCSNAYVS